MALTLAHADRLAVAGTVLPMAPTERFYCPDYLDPARYGAETWPCPDVPCFGHRVTKAVLAAADAIAEEDGYDTLAGVPQHWRQIYLNWAGVLTWAA